jgi:hypothetical protein
MIGFWLNVKFLAQFTQVHIEQHSSPQSSRQKTTINGLERRIRRRNIAVKKPQSKLALAATNYEHVV